jgi:antitoxin ParD1/3/4
VEGTDAEAAMSTINVSLTPYLRRWIDTQVAGGRYGSTSEVVRAAIRLLEDAEREREVRLRDLRAAIDEGDASGDPAPLDLDRIVAAGRASSLPDPTR